MPDSNGWWNYDEFKGAEEPTSRAPLAVNRMPAGQALPLPAPPTPAAPPPPNAESTLMSLMNQRDANPQDLNLRDQEHAQFSRVILDKYGPVLGSAIVASAVPTYSAAKGGAQALGLMKDATPASFREVGAGLAPLWGGAVGPAQPPQPAPPAPPGPVMYQQLHTLLRLFGVIK